MTNTMENARDVAVWALRDRGGNVSAQLKRLLGQCKLEGAEKSLARELALGVVRRRQTLRCILQAFLVKPDLKLPAPLEEILEVGLYQILFLQRVPQFAAVNEAVNQAVRFRHKRQGGLINGLLRNLVRSVSDPINQRPPISQDVIPIGPNLYRKLDRAIFPDPRLRGGEYLAEAYSLPLILAERWLDRSSSLQEAVNLAMHANVRAPIILRVNRLRTTVEEVLESLTAAGVDAHPHQNGCSVVLSGFVDVSKLEVFKNGWVQAQDATATSVSLAAEPKPGMNVLDFCAAPGTKTTHLGELMDNCGSITAVDISQSKLSRIESNCQRLGVSIVTPILADQVGQLTPGSFDLALVDAPCTNTGVLARRAETRWRFNLQKLSRLAADQRVLGQLAAQFVRPGGRVVYSTCSIEPEECTKVARSLTGVKMIREQLVTPAGADDPHRWYDGGYFAIFEVL